MKTVTALILGGIAAALLLVVSNPRAAPPPPTSTPVGYYDVNQVLSKSKTATATIAEASRSLEARERYARQAVDQYHAAEKGPLSGEVLATKRQETQAIVEEYNKSAEAARASAVAKVNERMTPIVARLATERRMLLVFPLGDKLPYASPEADLTDAIVEALDKGGK